MPHKTIVLALVAAIVLVPLTQTAGARTPRQTNLTSGCANGVSASFAMAHGTILCASSSQRLGESLGGPGSTSTGAGEVLPTGGFGWADALIGAAVTAGIFLIGVAGVLVLLYRRREPSQP